MEEWLQNTIINFQNFFTDGDIRKLQSCWIMHFWQLITKILMWSLSVRKYKKRNCTKTFRTRESKLPLEWSKRFCNKIRQISFATNNVIDRKKGELCFFNIIYSKIAPLKKWRMILLGIRSDFEIKEDKLMEKIMKRVKIQHEGLLTRQLVSDG